MTMVSRLPGPVGSQMPERKNSHNLFREERMGGAKFFFKAKMSKISRPRSGSNFSIALGETGG